MALKYREKTDYFRQNAKNSSMTGNVLTFRKHSENLLIFFHIYCIIGARWWKVERMCGKVVEMPLKWRKETQIGSR